MGGTPHRSYRPARPAMRVRAMAVLALATLLSIVGLAPAPTSAQGIDPGAAVGDWATGNGAVFLGLRADGSYLLFGRIGPTDIDASGPYEIQGDTIVFTNDDYGDFALTITALTDEAMTLDGGFPLSRPLTLERRVTSVPLLGTTWGVFIGLTVVLFGGAALMTGQALANTWQEWWKAVPYCLLLTCGDRFLVYGLFDGELLLVSGFVVDFLVLLAICTLAFRITRARKMVTQYPWLYRRRGLFGWAPRGVTKADEFKAEFRL